MVHKTSSKHWNGHQFVYTIKLIVMHVFVVEAVMTWDLVIKVPLTSDSTRGIICSGRSEGL